MIALQSSIALFQSGRTSELIRERQFPAGLEVAETGDDGQHERPLVLSRRDVIQMH